MLNVIPKTIRTCIALLGRRSFRKHFTGRMVYLYAMNRIQSHRRYRDLQRSAPVSCATRDHIGAPELFLTSGTKHLSDAIYAAKSFLFHAGRPLRLYIIADASVDCDAIRLFEDHLPNVTVLTKDYRDAIVENALVEKGLPRCVTWRRTSVLASKLIDPLVLCKGEFVLQIDSDTVTFRSLDNLFRQIKNNPRRLIFGYDQNAECYCLPLSLLPETLGVSIPGHINTGLTYMPRDAIDFQQIEKWLENTTIPLSNRFVEQTFAAGFGALHGYDFWDNCAFNMGRTVNEDEATLIHYCDYPFSDTRLAMRQIGQRLFGQQLRQEHRLAQVGHLGDDLTGSSASVAAVGDSS